MNNPQGKRNKLSYDSLLPVGKKALWQNPPKNLCVNTVNYECGFASLYPQKIKYKRFLQLNTWNKKKGKSRYGSYPFPEKTI